MNEHPRTMTDDDIRKILQATNDILRAIQASQTHLAELITNSRSHLVVATESMGAEVKEQKGLLVWLKAWALRLHK